MANSPKNSKPEANEPEVKQEVKPAEEKPTPVVEASTPEDVSAMLARVAELEAKLAAVEEVPAVANGLLQGFVAPPKAPETYETVSGNQRTDLYG